MRRVVCAVLAAAVAACGSDPPRPPEMPAVTEYTSTPVAEEQSALVSTVTVWVVVSSIE